MVLGVIVEQHTGFSFTVQIREDCEGADQDSDVHQGC